VKALRLASFGIRGFVGETLSPGVLIDFAAAFGTFAEGGRIVVGRDTRRSSPMVRSAVIAGLMGSGCEILDFGVCPTPMTQFGVGRYEAAGAVSISAGHTKMGWNALTLIGADGATMDPFGGQTVLDIFHARHFRTSDWRSVGSVRAVTDFVAPYFNALEAAVDAEAIRRRGFTVLIDPVNGAGCGYIEPFARRFGLKVIPVNAEPSGYLSHDPEPRPRNAKQVASIIQRVDGDVGFVLSSDMGRLSVVSEDGETTSEEYTFALIANHTLAKRTGPVITNCCTTRTIDDVAAAHGARVVKTQVGQPFVVSALMDEDGVIGGEGNGSCVVPSFSLAFDGWLMMALILEAMAQGRCTASDLLAELPRYHIVKRKVYCDSRLAYRALGELEARDDWRAGGKVNTTDGMRVDWDDGWVHVRASHTEAMIRVISEAREKQQAEGRAIEVGRILEMAL
jgi:phosphoglucosamine mutase